MDNYREIMAGILWRSFLALTIGGLGWWLLAEASGGMAAVPRLLFGLACLVGAAIIVAPALARLFAERSGVLFYPTEHFDRPLPMYSIPQSKRTKGHYEEAIAGYEKIARDYPNEVTPYIEMISIATVDLKDPERAKRICQRGMAALAKDRDKEVLAQMYGAIRTRLNARPSN